MQANLKTWLRRRRVDLVAAEGEAAVVTTPSLTACETTPGVRPEPASLHREHRLTGIVVAREAVEADRGLDPARRLARCPLVDAIARLGAVRSSLSERRPSGLGSKRQALPEIVGASGEAGPTGVAFSIAIEDAIGEAAVASASAGSAVFDDAAAESRSISGRIG